MVLQKLASLTGDVEWQGAAHRQMWFLAGAISDYPSTSTFGVLAMMDALYPHRELVCTTRTGIPEALRRYLRENPAEDMQILLKTEENAELLASCATFTKDYPISEQETMYYLCENGACKAPVTDIHQIQR